MSADPTQRRFVGLLNAPSASEARHSSSEVSSSGLRVNGMDDFRELVLQPGPQTLQNWLRCKFNTSFHRTDQGGEAFGHG